MDNARMDENKPRRRWLSFGIRDLLWATVVLGMGLGWWAEYRYDRERTRLLDMAIEQSSTTYDDIDSRWVNMPIRGFIKFSDGTTVEWEKPVESEK